MELVSAAEQNYKNCVCRLECKVYSKKRWWVEWCTPINFSSHILIFISTGALGDEPSDRKAAARVPVVETQPLPLLCYLPRDIRLSESCILRHADDLSTAGNLNLELQAYARANTHHQSSFRHQGRRWHK